MTRPPPRSQPPSTVPLDRRGPRRWRPGRRARVVGYAALAAALAIAFRAPLFWGNFGVVDPGRVFRSAQPERNLDGLIRDQRLGAILNLRGGGSNDPFYAHEVRAAAAASVEFWDVPLGATRRPSRDELLRVLRVFEVCRYPLLIHCKWGSDRTGLVSALYRMDQLGEPPQAAARALTLSHGHVPLFGPERLHEPIDEYASWLKAHNLPHQPRRLRSWIASEYRSSDPFRGMPQPKPGPRPPGHSHAVIR